MDAGRKRERRSMHLGDGVFAAINLVVGVFLGSVAYDLVELATTDWPFAFFLTLLSVGFFLFVLAFDVVFDRLFTIGIRPAPQSQPNARKPLALVLSMPVGFVLGLLLAWLGLDDAVLGILF